MVPSVLRHPAGPLPRKPGRRREDVGRFSGSKEEAERRLAEWATTGCGGFPPPCTTLARGLVLALAINTATTRRSVSYPVGLTAKLWHSHLN